MANGTFPVERSPFDFYNFVDDGNRGVLVERGLVPWWASPNLTIRFLRPLSSALLYLDHKAFGDMALPMHLHSLAWWVVAVLLVRSLFRATFSPRVAAIGTCVFALAPCHAMPLAWLANREALVSIVFGLLALNAYTKWRDARAPASALVAGAFFALAMLGGGEYALSFGGYVLAIEIVRKADGLVKRAAGMLPFVVPALLYLAVRGALRYGAAGSGFYSDPLREPWVFAKKAPWRAVALVIESWWTYDVASFSPSNASWFPRVLLAVLGLSSAVAIGTVLRRVLRTLSEKERSTATWLIMGSLFALVPLLAVVPALRLLGVASIGVAIATALIVDHVWFPKPNAKASELASLVAVGLGFAQLVHGPFTSFLASRQHRRDALAFSEHTAWLRDQLGDVPKARVGIVRGMATSFFTPFALGPRAPQKWRLLAHAGHVLVLREDERTFEIVSLPQRSLFPTGDGNLFRSEDRPLRVGDTIKVPGLRATIIGVSPAGPRDVRIQLDDDPSAFVWFTDGFEGWKNAELPQPGFGAPFDP